MSNVLMFSIFREAVYVVTKWLTVATMVQLRVWAGRDNRTIDSASAALAGFLPPKVKWNENINWRPIPVHTNILFDMVKSVVFFSSEKAASRETVPHLLKNFANPSFFTSVQNLFVLVTFCV